MTIISIISFIIHHAVITVIYDCLIKKNYKINFNIKRLQNIFQFYLFNLHFERHNFNQNHFISVRFSIEGRFCVIKSVIFSLTSL